MAQTDTQSGQSFRSSQPMRMNALDWISMVLMIIGGLNWGLVGALDLDLVAALLGPGSMGSRIVYMLVGLAALYGVILMARMGRSSAR